MAYGPPGTAARMDEKKMNPKQLAEELATNAQDDPRFKNRTPGIRATRQGSVEQADQDAAGIVGGKGISGGGASGGGTLGQPPTGRLDDDQLADTVAGTGLPPDDEEDEGDQ
ncbi:hypothetical protein IL992_01860 [Microbispora sp. NEAU-D428]|nr:hypothetical protein [Microbispora sitophila]MBE3007940.1 hypothetical protein [Microbispora sitophila]